MSRDRSTYLYLYFSGMNLFAIEDSWLKDVFYRKRILRTLQGTYPQGSMVYKEYENNFSGRKSRVYIPSFYATTEDSLVFTDASSTYFLKKHP